MGTFDVGLSLRQKPIFPEICVACEKLEPNHTMKISVLGAKTGSMTESVTDGLLDIGTGSSASNNFSTRISGIPICKGCEGKMKWYHRLLKFATYTIWLPGILVFLVMPGPIWIRVIIFVAIIVAPPILSMIFPPAFGATILNGNANYEFRSQRIAQEFMQLNCPPESSSAGATEQSLVESAKQ